MSLLGNGEVSDLRKREMRRAEGAQAEATPQAWLVSGDGGVIKGMHVTQGCLPPSETVFMQKPKNRADRRLSVHSS